MPAWKTLAVLGYAMISFVVNGAIKVFMITWRIPLEVA